MMANITDMFDSISIIAFENIAFDLLYKAWHSRNIPRLVILECFQGDARLVQVFELILVGC
jgi:uncharacterized membrane protein